MDDARLARRRRRSSVSMRSQCISRLAPHLVLADDRDVVLRLAGDHAGAAARADAQVDRHRPLIAAVLVLGKHRVGGAPVRRGEVGIAAVFLQCPAQGDRAIVRIEVLLGERQRITVGARTEVRSRDRVEVRPRTQRVGVHADPRSHLLLALPAVTEPDGRHAVSHSGRHQHRRAHGHRRRREVDDLFVLHAEDFRGGGAEERGVVPGELLHGRRLFLQPGVVGEPPVVDRR